jgi:hypothetical protein
MRILINPSKKSKQNKFNSKLLCLITDKQLYTNLEIEQISEKVQKNKKKTKKLKKKKNISSFKSKLIKASKPKPKKDTKTSYKIELINE